ncbi:conserved hypothetical protein [Sporisorium reilianum SRZ2]|uniref:Uncharacterized protein n=1 Tax=Sporisorium reilianum (strain SRZ2) TaxID=999809 RepID=E6ZSE1_SPORE|nr:conserved hypothetical protein [Sporisorium reilianum SRZ2]
MSLLRTSFSSLRVAAAGRRTLATTSIRRTDDPNILNKDTQSGASVKADKHSKDPHTLQKETAQSFNASSSRASANDAPTHSEDAVHGEKHNKSPEQLQNETAHKAQQ